MASESEFDKQKALFEQQIQFLENRNAALESREKELMAEIKSQKRETTDKSNAFKLKYESQIHELTHQLEDQNDTLFEKNSKI